MAQEGVAERLRQVELVRKVRREVGGVRLECRRRVVDRGHARPPGLCQVLQERQYRVAFNRT